MEAFGQLVTLEARRGKEADAEAFLKSAQPLALDEIGTLKWYAIKLEPGNFGIFDTFANEAGRNAYLTGKIAKALGASAIDLLAIAPHIEKVDVLASTPFKGLREVFKYLTASGKETRELRRTNNDNEGKTNENLTNATYFGRNSQRQFRGPGDQVRAPRLSSAPRLGVTCVCVRDRRERYCEGQQSPRRGSGSRSRR